MTPSSFPRRGEVYWTSLDPSYGAEMQKTRPCLVVTTDFVNRTRFTVVIIPLSQTSPKGFPLYVPLRSVSATSQAVIDQIRVVDRERPGDYAARLTSAEMEAISDAMKMVFGLV